MFGSKSTGNQDEINSNYEFWKKIIPSKDPSHKITLDERLNVYAEDKIGSENYYQKTLFPSRLPIFTIYNFQVDHSNPNNYEDVSDISIGTLNLLKSDQQLIGSSLSKASARKHYGQSSKKRKFSENKGTSDFEDDTSDDSDNVDENVDENVDDINELTGDSSDDEKTTNSITLMVYYNSFSIDNSPSIPLTSPILTATVIKAKSKFHEDTLVLLLQSGLILLIRFQYCETKSRLKPKYTPYIVYYLPQSINLFTIEDRIVHKFSVSEHQDKLFLSSYNGITMVYNLVYDNNNIPRLDHSHNFTTPAKIVDQCVVNLAPHKDILLTIELLNNILRIESIKDFETFESSSQLMKSSFSIPIFTIPLCTTQSVLFLQEESFTIKSFLFCLGGEDIAHLKVNYSTLGNDFTINSYYIPKEKIFTESITKYPSRIYNHDQILISTSNDASVYILDIYFDRIRHKYSYDLNRLFKYKKVITFFSFEPLGKNEFKFIFSNEFGDSRSKIVKLITNDNDKPVLETVSTIWDEINTYPLFDYEIITSPTFKYSIESYQQEIWMLAGAGSNHSLVNLKNAYSSIKESLSSGDFKGFVQIHKSTKTNCYWFEGESRLCLMFIDVNVRPILELKTNANILTIYEFESNEVLITNNEIMIFDKFDFNIKYTLKFPNEVTLATAMDDKIAVIYEEGVELKFSLFTLSIDDAGFEIKDINFNGCLQAEVYEISMIQFIKRNDCINLIVGLTSGIIDLYNIRSYGIELNVGVEIKVEDPKIKLTSNVHHFKFIPYQIHQLENLENFIVSSKNGSYALVRFTLDTDAYVIASKSIHLSDNGDLEIIETDDKDIVYLKSKYLWKLDYKRSLYPEKVLLEDDLRELSITCAISMPGLKEIEWALIIQNGELSKLEIAEFPSMLKRTRTFGIPSMNLKYLTNSNLFSMITLPTNFQESPILFADHKSMKILKIETDMSKIFNSNEVPTCVFEWSIPNGSMYHTVVVVGCKTKEGKGVMKLLKVSKNSQIQLKLLYTINEENPVTDIKNYIDDVISDSQLVYSSGSNIYSFSYNLHTKKFEDRKLIFEGSSLIKRFYFSKKDSGVVLVSCFQNNTSFITYFTPGLESVIKTKALSEFTSDLLLLSNNEYILSDYNKETLKISNLSKKIDLMYIPRISPINAFPPWVTLNERMDKTLDQFVTVGLNGQFDLIKGENKEIKDKYFYSKIFELQDEKNCTIPIYNFMSRVHFQQLENLDTVMNVRMPGDFSWELKERYLNSVRV